MCRRVCSEPGWLGHSLHWAESKAPDAGLLFRYYCIRPLHDEVYVPDPRECGAAMGEKHS